MSNTVLPKQTDLPTIWRVSDPLWEQIAPLLKIEKPRKKPGCPRADDRRINDCLIYMARTGSQWRALPAEFGPKSTVYDRFREWVKYGCLQKVWSWLLQQYDQVIGIDWEWQAADGCIVKAPLGKTGVEGETQATGRNPTDRGKSGSKRHLLTEGKGVPLAVVLSGANRHDMKNIADLLDAIVIERPVRKRWSSTCVLTGAMTMRIVVAKLKTGDMSRTFLIPVNPYHLQMTQIDIHLVVGSLR